jgi:hypothetical protein
MFSRTFLKTAIYTVLTSSVCLPIFPTSAQTPFNALNFTNWLQAQTSTNPALTEALITYLKKQGSSLNETNYRSAEIDLNGDNKKDALVLLQGMNWCGSGGCTMLIFQGTGGGFRLVSHITLVREPVIVSETRTKGWRDIIVHVSGGGDVEGHNIPLKFNGSTYPTNPSLERALPPKTKVRGVEVFPDPQQ